MIYPKFIDKNGCIGVPAPSAGANTIQRTNRMKNAIENLNNLGYKLILSNNLYKSEKGRSASAKVRGKEVNNMFENNEVDLILCAAGGEFLVEMLPFVDFETLKKHPKFVAGFSDPTGLLYPITTLCDIATIYGQNFGSFGKEKISKYESDFIDVITGKTMEVESYELYEEEPVEQVTGLELDNLTHEVYWKTLDEKPASFQGRIIGGCFDIIAELCRNKV